MVKMVHRNFNKYAVPLIESFMVGEVTTLRYTVNPGHSPDRDWVAKTRFRNSLAASVYNGAAYMMDILTLCRMCKIWLVTEDIFDIITTYYWVNPIYRTQFLGTTGTDADYGSMLYTSDRYSQKYIRNHLKNLNNLQVTVLDLIRFYTMKMTNRSTNGINAYMEFDNAEKRYKSYMKEHHEQAYLTARRFKAQPYLVDSDGYIILEPIDKQMGGK